MNMEIYKYKVLLTLFLSDICVGVIIVEVIKQVRL